MPQKLLKDVWNEIHSQAMWGYLGDPRVQCFVWRNYFHLENKKQIKFLDIGCGVGAQAMPVAWAGFTTIGIDISSVAIGTANKVKPPGLTDLSYMVADVRDLPFEDGEFDCAFDVACLECLELDDAQQALAEIRRVLKPEGILFSITESVGGEPPQTPTSAPRYSTYGDIIDLYCKHFTNLTACQESQFDRLGTKLLRWVVEAKRKP